MAQGDFSETATPADARLVWQGKTPGASLQSPTAAEATGTAGSGDAGVGGLLSRRGDARNLSRVAAQQAVLVPPVNILVEVCVAPASRASLEFPAYHDNLPDKRTPEPIFKGAWLTWRDSAFSINLRIVYASEVTVGLQFGRRG